MGATSDLLSGYQHVIDELRLVTGASGVFDVSCDGHLLYSKSDTGRHAADGEVLRLFAEHIGPDVARFGT